MTGRCPGRPSLLCAAGAAILLGAMLLGLAGCNPNDGGGDVTWPPPPVQTGQPWFFDIWGSSASDIYVVGRPGVILHWNGADWQLQDVGTTDALTAVWGASASEVYAVGHQGLIYRSNGTSWSKMTSNTTRDFYDVGRGPEGFTYVCGEKGVLLKLVNGTWTDTPDSAVLYNPAGTATIDTLLRSDGDIASLTCVTDRAISGSDGVALMTDVRASRWLLAPIDTEDWLNTGWGSETTVNNWLATDTGRLYRLQYISGRFSWLEVSSPANIAVDGMWVQPDNLSGYFVTRDGRAIRRASDGSVIVTLYDGEPWLSAVWGTAPDNIYAVGYDATLLHFNGATWSPITAPLPETKSAVSEDTDKFGRPLR